MFAGFLINVLTAVQHLQLFVKETSSIGNQWGQQRLDRRSHAATDIINIPAATLRSFRLS